jgi:hypothetical protein
MVSFWRNKMKEFKLEDLLGQPNGMMFECLECGEDLGENIADIEPTSDAVMVKTDVNETTSRIWWFCDPACAVKYIDKRLSALPLVSREKIYG